MHYLSLHPRKGVSDHRQSEIPKCKIAKNLSWNHCVDSVCRRANNATAFLRGNLSSCPAKIKDMCYKTLVWLVPRYNMLLLSEILSQKWTSTMYDKSVERRAVRIVTNYYNTTSSLTWMTDRQGLDSLRHRQLPQPLAHLTHRLKSGLQSKCYQNC